MNLEEASRVGRRAGTLFEGSRRFDLLLLQPPASLTPEAFGELLVGSPGGELLSGLAIVDTLARRWRGRAALANRLEGGTRAEVRFPAAASVKEETWVEASS